MKKVLSVMVLSLIIFVNTSTVFANTYDNGIYTYQGQTFRTWLENYGRLDSTTQDNIKIQIGAIICDYAMDSGRALIPVSSYDNIETYYRESLKNIGKNFIDRLPYLPFSNDYYVLSALYRIIEYTINDDYSENLLITPGLWEAFDTYFQNDNIIMDMLKIGKSQAYMWSYWSNLQDPTIILDWTGLLDAFKKDPSKFWVYMEGQRVDAVAYTNTINIHATNNKFYVSSRQPVTPGTTLTTTSGTKIISQYAYGPTFPGTLDEQMSYPVYSVLDYALMLTKLINSYNGGNGTLGSYITNQWAVIDQAYATRVYIDDIDLGQLCEDFGAGEYDPREVYPWMTGSDSDLRAGQSIVTEIVASYKRQNTYPIYIESQASGFTIDYDASHSILIDGYRARAAANPKTLSALLLRIISKDVATQEDAYKIIQSSGYLGYSTDEEQSDVLSQPIYGLDRITGFLSDGVIFIGSCVQAFASFEHPILYIVSFNLVLIVSFGILARVLHG